LEARGKPFSISSGLDERVPKHHLLRIDRFVTAALADMHRRLKPYYNEIDGRS
jgi:hypothetical protein